jgi:osmotically-inducible protein OsmY
MSFLLLRRKADEMGINFWLRIIAASLFLSLTLLGAYYFLYVNRESAQPVIVATPVIDLAETERKKSDTAMMTRIKAAMTQSKRLHSQSIGVECKEGKITLFGDVQKEADRDLAENLAKEVANVQVIKNEIKVSGSSVTAEPAEEKITSISKVQDLELEANLLESIQTIPELSTKNIKIKVTNREVNISGQVANEQQRIRIIQIINNTPTVGSVSNNLKIGG